MTSPHKNDLNRWLIDDARSCQPAFNEGLHQRLMQQVRRQAARAPSRASRPHRWGRLAATCALVAALLLLAVRTGIITPSTKSTRETAKRGPVAWPETSHRAREAGTLDEHGEIAATTDGRSFCDGLGLRIALLKTGPSEVLMTLTPRPTTTSDPPPPRNRERDGVHWRHDQQMLVLGF